MHAHTHPCNANNRVYYIVYKYVYIVTSNMAMHLQSTVHSETTIAIDLNSYNRQQCTYTSTMVFQMATQSHIYIFKFYVDVWMEGLIICETVNLAYTYVHAHANQQHWNLVQWYKCLFVCIMTKLLHMAVCKICIHHLMLYIHKNDWYVHLVPYIHIYTQPTQKGVLQPMHTYTALTWSNKADVHGKEAHKHAQHYRCSVAVVCWI